MTPMKWSHKTNPLILASPSFLWETSEPPFLEELIKLKPLLKRGEEGFQLGTNKQVYNILFKIIHRTVINKKVLTLGVCCQKKPSGKLN